MNSLKDRELLYLFVNDADGHNVTEMFESDDTDEFCEYLNDLAVELEFRGLLDLTFEIEVADEIPIMRQKRRLNNKALSVLSEVFIMTASWGEDDIDEQEYKQKLYEKLNYK
ncbi:hypothetical protein [Photobacterium damselae]|uniref:hypothetical protein n=1 Tax=Photobacterium damselae TaxID=38293 RepID=UPI00406979BA